MIVGSMCCQLLSIGFLICQEKGSTHNMPKAKETQTTPYFVPCAVLIYNDDCETMGMSPLTINLPYTGAVASVISSFKAQVS